MSAGRPEVALDCDGLLCHFAQHVIEKVNAATGAQHTFDMVTTWEIFDSLSPGDHDLKKRIYDELREEGGASSLPFFEEAKEGVKRLQEIADVFIVTSPFRPSRTWMSEREDWLYRHFNISAKDVIHCAGERKYRVDADVFVDDKAETVETWSRVRKGRLALLWAAPYNQDSLLPRVSSWHQLFDRVRAVAPQ